jgi:broad-specificity NMP kinase
MLYRLGIIYCAIFISVGPAFAKKALMNNKEGTNKMKDTEKKKPIVIIIYGEPATGKLTIAKELARRTGYKILDNHSTIDLILKFFEIQEPSFDRLIQKIRMLIIEELMQANKSVIWTTGMPNIPSTRFFYKNLQQYVLDQGGIIKFCHLKCSKEEQAKRVVNKSRYKSQKIQDVEKLKKALGAVDFNPGDMLKNSLSIDNTSRSAEHVTEKIIRFIENN